MSEKWYLAGFLRQLSMVPEFSSSRSPNYCYHLNRHMSLHSVANIRGGLPAIWSGFPKSQIYVRALIAVDARHSVRFLSKDVNVQLVTNRLSICIWSYETITHFGRVEQLTPSQTSFVSHPHFSRGEDMFAA